MIRGRQGQAYILQSRTETSKHHGELQNEQEYQVRDRSEFRSKQGANDVKRKDNNKVQSR